MNAKRRLTANLEISSKNAPISNNSFPKREIFVNILSIKTINYFVQVKHFRLHIIILNIVIGTYHTNTIFT